MKPTYRYVPDDDERYCDAKSKYLTGISLIVIFGGLALAFFHVDTWVFHGIARVVTALAGGHQ